MVKPVYGSPQWALPRKRSRAFGAFFIISFLYFSGFCYPFFIPEIAQIANNIPYRLYDDSGLPTLPQQRPVHLFRHKILEV